jgi:hypothetical protein
MFMNLSYNIKFLINVLILVLINQLSNVSICASYFYNITLPKVDIVYEEIRNPKQIM